MFKFCMASQRHPAQRNVLFTRVFDLMRKTSWVMTSSTARAIKNHMEEFSLAVLVYSVKRIFT